MRPRPLVFALALLAPLACRSVKTSDAHATPSTEKPSTQQAANAPAGSKANDNAKVGTNPGNAGEGTPLTPATGHALAAFSEGCFWGSENTYRHVAGVISTAVGYTGGHTTAPTYETVCSHTTGHAETVLIEFDPKVVSYEQLLKVFFATHDPTLGDRQGPDVGDQYRSAIWTFSDDEASAARKARDATQTTLSEKITTEIKPIGAFWKAEEYHQQYDEKAGVELCGVKVMGEKT